nr:hypothetical protein [Lachnospiraceae bacterium]
DIFRKDDNCIKNSGFIKDCMMFLLGGMVFFLTFFPYCVKRNSYLGVIYLGGRDTVLLGFGVAVLIYYGINIFFNKKITKPLLICFTILGIIHFNFVYLDWQESYYQQVQLQHEIAQNDEIRNNDTFLIMYKGDMICSNFYQTNGNSWEATGEETRYYMPGVASLVGLIDMNDDTWFLNAYGMNEYEYGEKVVDGIIFVDYTDIGRRTILKQKFNEIFNYPAFDKWIDDIKNIKYVPVTKEESDDMIKKCIDGELTDQMIYDMYY